jgi:hypothetical protein
MTHPKVFLGMPHYGQVEFEAVQGAYQATLGGADVHLYPSRESRLPHNFNKLWCEALNTRASERWTHFAMLHADIVPMPGWLDVLLAEQRRVRVHLVSAVVLIKDARRYTSTGIWNGRDTVLRLTEKEVLDLPATFTRRDICCQEDTPLVVNTGCWVCDFTQPWVEQVAFKFVDVIQQVDGQFVAANMPEDWDFSLQLHRLGVPYAATRLVELAHVGPQAWILTPDGGGLDHDAGGR